MAETQEYRYDVFISYSHADEAWIEKTLLPRLEGAGLKVCIDYRDFLARQARAVQHAGCRSRQPLHAAGADTGLG